jgi:hypothetical protein
MRSRRSRPWTAPRRCCRCGPGSPKKATHDYVRHGTTTLFAALEVATGKVTGACYPRHRHQEFLRSSSQVAKAYPRASEAAHRHRQLRHAQAPGREGLAGEEPADHAALHPDLGVVAEHGRDLLRHHRATSIAALGGRLPFMSTPGFTVSQNNWARLSVLKTLVTKYNDSAAGMVSVSAGLAAGLAMTGGLTFGGWAGRARCPRGARRPWRCARAGRRRGGARHRHAPRAGRLPPSGGRRALLRRFNLV